MSFSAAINEFAKKTSASLDETSRAIKISLFGSVIGDTRVDTGRLKGNWQTSTGSPNYNTTDRTDKDGTKATAEVERTVKGDTVDYLTNNLPYAEVYEEKDAMVEKNVTRINRIIKESVRKL